LRTGAGRREGRIRGGEGPKIGKTRNLGVENDCPGRKVRQEGGLGGTGGGKGWDGGSGKEGGGGEG